MGRTPSKEYNPNPEQTSLPQKTQIPRIILLGAGDTGKSTFYIKSKLVCNAGALAEFISKDQKALLKRSISRLWIYFLRLAITMRNSGYDGPAVDRVQRFWGDILNRNRRELGRFVPDKRLRDALAMYFYSEEGQRLLWEKRNAMYLPDCLGYFIFHRERFFSGDFEPTEMDVLLRKLKTTGVIYDTLDFQGKLFEMLDTGGQRTERQKWPMYYDNLILVVFTVSLIDFDLEMYEDNSTNRAEDSFNLFKDILVLNNLINLPCVVVFTQRDVLLKKIFEMRARDVSVSQYFPSIDDNLDPVSTRTAIEEDFIRRYRKALTESKKATNLVSFQVVSSLESEDITRCLTEIYSFLQTQSEQVIGGGWIDTAPVAE